MLSFLPRDWLLLVLVGVLRPQRAAGQDGSLTRRDWVRDQINTTMCTWEQPRGAVIRDTFYLDGGYLSFVPGFANGTLGTFDQPEDGSMLYTINFTQPFNTSQNASDILRTIPKATTAGSNVSPNFYDGMMFANDDELYLYGGLLRDTDGEKLPSATDALGYEQYQYGPYRERWTPGIYSNSLPDDITRYVTGGAGVNVPSENLGFYFSGLRGQNWGEIRAGGQPRYNATVIAKSLVSINMTTMRNETYSNKTIDSSIPGRVNGELAWIPTSDQGLLVAIGGVINPEWAFVRPTDQMKVQSQNTSPGFMKSVPVYDIANDNWYSQPTSGDTPPQLTQFCSVVASAKDGSSHNVYIYGGWDGLDDTDAPSDDVYILSVPSFVWVKALNGTSSHGRRSHKCAQVYPDQMFVVGGQTQQLDTYTCLDQGLIQIFNLNTLQWQEKYDPNVWSEYKVPDIVIAAIGGSADGAATTTKPSKWSDNDLADLFGTKYTKNITKYYPYKSISPTSTNSPSATSSSSATSTPPPKPGVPSFVAPVVGVVLGLVLITVILTCILLYRRRKYFSRYPGSTVDGTSNFQQARVWNWISGNPPPQVVDSTKEGTVTSTTEDPSSVSAPTMGVGPYGEQLDHETGRPLSPELGTDSQIHELPGTPTTYELATMQTGLTPAATTGPKSRLSPRPPLSTSSSAGSAGSAGAGAAIQRPDSPTTSDTSFRPGHQRQVSSLDSSTTDLNAGIQDPQVPPHQVPLPQDEASVWDREGAITPPSANPTNSGDPMERAGLLSPVSPALDSERQQRRRQSSFAEHVE
ncbi:MAG: hypothetical protein M4579_006227 [Chaenotheca gracillima]|nr:MAG: hypothetical protein M4579_006227 [Chaenotheca gracillima]